MTLTVEEKIDIIKERILETERVIRYVEFPSQEEIEAQETLGIRDLILNQVTECRQIIQALNALVDELKG